MNESQKNNDWKTSFDEPLIKDSVYTTGISRLVHRLHATSTIYIVAGAAQLLLGLTVIAVSILGYIRPLWLSTMLTAISSLSAMLGFFLVYHTVSKMYDQDQLLRSAMKRVMESKN